MFSTAIFTKKRLSLAILAATSLSSLPALAEEADVEIIQVYGEQRATATATKLDLSIYETPQTVTAISSMQIQDFELDNTNKLLDYTPGVTVEEIETDRTYYTARGFDIVNFQYDGVGVPFIGGLNLGQQDTAIYEKVEVVKGAAGLITGLANPSATINYIRKRPTDELKASSSLSLGQWNKRRLDGDVSGSLSTSVRGRAVLAYDKSDSYLDRHSDETQLGYGILEFDLTDNTLLTVGHSIDKSQSDGVLWGALPLVYSDGSQTDFDVSTSTAPEWTFADATQTQTFIELEQWINTDWRFNAIATKNKSEYESELFYVSGSLDRTTGTGLSGYASAYDREEKQLNIDAYFTGDFSFGGQYHQIVLGYSHSDTDVIEASYYNYAEGLPVLESDWAEGNSPRPDFVDHNPAANTTDIELTQEAFYLATRLNITDQLSVLAGARKVDLEQTGVSYGGDSNTSANETVPYYGATFKFTDDMLAYASYSEVFKQQTWVNEEFKPLGPVNGESKEFGFKKTFNNKRAVLTLARFESEQNNFGVFRERMQNEAGSLIAVYDASTVESEGYEVELSGEVFSGFNLGMGYTQVNIEDANGAKARPFIPKNLVKVSASYILPALPALKLGGIVKWQDDTQTASGAYKQDAYALLDLMASYQLSNNLTVSVNLQNLTDKKYINSLYWDQGYYGAPRSASASIRWTY